MGHGQCTITCLCVRFYCRMSYCNVCILFLRTNKWRWRRLTFVIIRISRSSPAGDRLREGSAVIWSGLIITARLQRQVNSVSTTHARCKWSFPAVRHTLTCLVTFHRVSRPSHMCDRMKWNEMKQLETVAVDADYWLFITERNDALQTSAEVFYRRGSGVLQ